MLKFALTTIPNWLDRCLIFLTFIAFGMINNQSWFRRSKWKDLRDKDNNRTFKIHRQPKLCFTNLTDLIKSLPGKIKVARKFDNEDCKVFYNVK